MDGRRQREAVSAIERALRAGVAGDIQGVLAGADALERLNQLFAYDGLPTQFRELAEALGDGDRVGAARAASVLSAILADSPLGSLADTLVASLR